jgi:glycosyltransferase involved in cell wall biosynthesis
MITQDPQEASAVATEASGSPMRVAVVTESRFQRTPDGAIWSEIPSYTFWKRYLDVFDSVLVVARVQEIEEATPRLRQADGPGITYASIPYYHGPLQFVKNARKIQDALRHALAPDDAVIMRIGSMLANCLEPVLEQKGRPYGVEVVGDPYDVYAPGTIRHPLRPFLRQYFSQAQRRQCARAIGAAYVTEGTLQKRYPCGALQISVSDVELPSASVYVHDGILTTHYSSLDIPRKAFARQRAIKDLNGKQIRLIHVASLEQLYKGTDVLLDAIKKCVREGLDLHLTILGSGRLQKVLEQRARRLGITDRIDFKGTVPAGDPVYEELDKADIFVLPSRTEGLPRAMIEAMARGLPCIGSTAGGMPELLPPSDLVPPGSVSALANKIKEVALSYTLRREMSERNVVRAEDYRADILSERRIAFYTHIREKTEEWLRERGLR